MKTFSLIAHPNSRKPRIETDAQGTLHVYVVARPQDGKANEHIITALARHFRVAKSLIRISRGIHSSKKTIQIS